LLIFAPLLIPVATALGINPLHFAIVIIIAMGIGAFSPPLGVGLYIACAIGGATVEQVIRPMLPYLIVLLVGLLVITFFPWVTLVLPEFLRIKGV